MHPPFFTAPHHRGPHHTAPAGVKSVPRRGAPARLDLSQPPPGLPPEAQPLSRRSRLALRVRFGRWLIALGRALAGEQPTPAVRPAKPGA